MKCKIECIIAFAFIVSSFYTMTVDRSIFKKFYKMLDNKQKTIYKSIRMDRLKIYIKGSMWAMVLSLIFKLVYKNNNDLVSRANIKVSTNE